MHSTDPRDKRIPKDPVHYKGFLVPSTRLKDRNYSAEGTYFVTICTKNRRQYFGSVNNTMEIELSDIGKIIEKNWESIPIHYPDVIIDTYRIMPDHFHGILIFEEDIHPHTLGSVINSFKGSCTKKVRELGYASFAWQPRFHDRIIRNQQEYDTVQKYIAMNPEMWWWKKEAWKQGVQTEM